MAGLCNLLGLAVIFVALQGMPSLAVAGDLPEWPTEQEERLNEVEQQSLELQRKLFVARMLHDAEEVERLSKEMKAVQKERVQLMRATGQLPPASQ